MADNPEKKEELGSIPTPEEEDAFEQAALNASDRDLDNTAVRDAKSGEEKTPSGKTPLPYLLICQGPRLGTRFTLTEEKNIIGRSPGCEVRLEDQSVSRQHAEISLVQGRWSVKDLGSKNRTVVNQSPVTEPVMIGHKDFIRVGIYLLRLITQEVSVAEEMTLPPEMVNIDTTLLVETPSAEKQKEELKKAEPKAMQPKTAAEEKPEAVEAEDEITEKTSIISKTRKYVAPIVMGILIIAAAGYLAHRFLMPPEKPSEKAAKTEKKEPKSVSAKPVTPKVAIDKEAIKPEAAKVPVVPPGAAVQEEAIEEQVPSAKKIPVFLDFASSPLPATITFEGKEFGKTPLRINTELEPNKSYAVEGTFDLPEVSESYVQKVEFTVDPDKPVIPLLIRGPIGMIKINDLPRAVEFYLEGSYEYDRFRERQIKLKELVLRKPIYIPYGNYVVELRKARRLGASQTYVSDIVFRREFSISADDPSYVISLTDEDLKSFPVTVRTEPTNASVFIDGEKVGNTPYTGNFPLGEHKMTLRKDGYFEYSEDLKVDINTPYKTTIALQTSVSGAHLNNAQAAMNRAMYQQAVNELAEALNSNPSPTEIAQANLMLGISYFKLGDIQRAVGYFEQARQSKEQEYPAMLGLVRCYHALERVDMALPLIVEVMLNAKDEEVKREATEVFQIISPLRSVVYIHSTPDGAEVTVNDQKIDQKTPLILHDVSLGTYKLHIEKPGYLPVDMRLNLSVNEFNPVVVTLKPIPR